MAAAATGAATPVRTAPVAEYYRYDEDLAGRAEEYVRAKHFGGAE